MANLKRSKPLEILERVIRNLPIKRKVVLRYADTDLARVYFGYGQDGNGDFHGAWGFTRHPGFARTLEFRHGVSEAMVAISLISDAYDFLEQMKARDMFKSANG